MYKKIMIFSIALAILSSCTAGSEKKAGQADTTANVVEHSTEGGPEIAEHVIVPADFLALVPLTVVDSTSDNVFEKYGIEFSGNCYACDLASLSVATNKMIWTNVCDDKDRLVVDDFTVSGDTEKTILKTTERTYILTQIDEAPVYELRIEGAALEMNNKRIATYYTTKDALELFKEHDCGEFDG